LNGATPGFLVDTLSLLREMGFRRIAVKLKAESQSSIIIPVLDAAGLRDDVTLLTGMFYEHVRRADRVIGGFSSGVFESAVHGVPYYVHEPFANGYSNADLARSSIVGECAVSRDRDGLRELLGRPQGSVEAPLSYLADGPSDLPWALEAG
jgi:hypothetical protein